MKKILSLFLSMLLVLCCLAPAALAEEAAYSLPDWTIAESGDGQAIPLTLLDSTAPVLSFATTANEYGDGEFTIAVGPFSYTQEGCCGLSGKVYVMKAGHHGTLIMVSEYGPSDDPYTYCFLYTTDKLVSVGGIPALPEDITVSGAGLMTATVRASSLCTWYRPADYTLAYGFSWGDGGDDYEEYYQICEVPRSVYPMGMIVTLLVDLPVYRTQFDAEPCATLTGGEQVILAATDDRSWLYVASGNGADGGWVRMDSSDYPTYISVGSDKTEAEKVFQYLLFAD